MTTEFFAPNTTYLRDEPYRAPEVLPEFQCVAIAVHPGKGEDRAFGFYRSGNASKWVSTAMTNDDWLQGWIVRPQPEPAFLDYDDGLGDFGATPAA